MKFIKRDPAGKLLYWEIWQDEKTLTAHFGEVGDPGEALEYELYKEDDGEAAMSELAEEQIAQGYTEFDPDSMFQMEVQYRIEGWGSEADLDMYGQLQELMNDCLQLTGNGESLESDFGGDTMNIGCYVIDPEKALATILQTLEEHGFAEGVTIAILEKSEEDDDENFRVLHPPGGEYHI